MGGGADPKGWPELTGTLVVFNINFLLTAFLNIFLLTVVFLIEVMLTFAVKIVIFVEQRYFFVT